MTEALFNITFAGEIFENHEIGDVKQHLAGTFDLDGATVERLFTGEPVPVKRQIDFITAANYLSALDRAGARCRFEMCDPDDGAQDQGDVIFAKVAEAVFRSDGYCGDVDRALAEIRELKNHRDQAREEANKSFGQKRLQKNAVLNQIWEIHKKAVNSLLKNEKADLKGQIKRMIKLAAEIDPALADGTQISRIASPESVAQLPITRPILRNLLEALGRARAKMQSIQRLLDDQGIKVEGDEVKTACFIATAVYGDADTYQLGVLRWFRDRRLNRSPVGAGAVRLYYRFSPPVGNFLHRHRPWRTPVRCILDRIVRHISLAGGSPHDFS